MTPFDLNETIRKAQVAVRSDPRQIQNVIFHLLTVLLQHEADKEAERLIASRHPPLHEFKESV